MQFYARKVLEHTQLSQRDRKQISAPHPRQGGGKERADCKKSTRELPGVMETFCILMGVLAHRYRLVSKLIKLCI